MISFASPSRIGGAAAAGPSSTLVDGVQQAVNAIEGKPAKSILTTVTVLTRANLAANSKYVYKSSC